MSPFEDAPTSDRASMPASDPTAIEITECPARLSGIAAHGNVPFDVPVFQQVAPNLWMGGYAREELPDSIVGVISLYPWERYRPTRRLMLEMYVTMFDADHVDANEVFALADLVNVYRQMLARTAPDKSILVHCQAGLNRSALVVATALCLEGSMGRPADVIRYLRSIRGSAVLCNRTFERWILGAFGDEAAA